MENPEKLATYGTQDKEKQNRNNPEKLATYGTQDKEKQNRNNPDLCTICCQLLWVVFVLFFFVLCTLYVASFSGLFLFCFSSSCVPYLLPVSLGCFCFVCLRLVYPICCQLVWVVFVLFFFVLCTEKLTT
jgi:apolipoprotein N-acyltransferase